MTCIVWIAGCSGGSDGKVDTNTALRTEGYILKVEQKSVLVAENISVDRYERIKDKTLQELQEHSVPLIRLRYSDTNNLSKGNRIEIWISGGIEESYPMQATAEKIELIEE